MKIAANAWIQAGGAHHTGYSYDVSAEQMEMLSEMAGVEFVLIDEQTNLRTFKKDLQLGEIYYGVRGL